MASNLIPEKLYKLSFILVIFALYSCGGGGSSGNNNPAPQSSIAHSWSNVGQTGGFIGSIAFHPTNAGEIWVSADDGAGIYRSTDNGATWILFDNTPPNQSSYSLTIDSSDPNRIYAPNHFGRGFTKTIDGGLTWTTGGVGLPVDTSQSAIENRRFNDMAIDPGSSSTLYACTQSGLYKSIDSGENFVLLSASLVSSTLETNLDCEIVTSSFSGPSAGAIFVGTSNRGVYKSIDSGVSWSVVVSPIATSGVLAVSAIALTDFALYVALNGGDIIRYPNFDNTAIFVINDVSGAGTGVIDSLFWTKLVTVTGVDAASDILHVGSVISPGSNKWGFFTSTDSGASFTKKNTGLDSYSVQALAVNPNDPQNVIFGTMGGGLYISPDAGTSWNSINTGFIGTGALGFAEDPADQNHLLMSASLGLSDNTGGFYETLNGGTSWSRVTSLPIDAVSLSISPTSSTTLLAATYKGGIYRSTNGTTGPWAQVLNRPNLTLARFVRDQVNSNKIYSIASPVRFATQTNNADLGIYFSDDDGATWNQRPDFGGYYVAPHPTNEGEAIAMGADVYATTDSFASASVSLGLAAFAPGKTFLSAAFDPANPLTVVVGTIAGEIYITNNYNATGTGVTWSELPNPATDVFIRNIVINADGWFAACWMGDMFSTPNSTEGILFSNDKGATWTFLENSIGQGRLVYEIFPSPTDPKRYHVGMWGSGLLRLTVTQ